MHSKFLVNSERFGFDESLLELFDDLGLTKDGETFVISASQFDDGISYIENESFTVFDIADFDVIKKRLYGKISTPLNNYHHNGVNGYVF